MKVALAIGVTAILVGISLMISGKTMCRGDCWIGDLFRYALPSRYETLAGGVPWVLMGVAMVVFTLLRRKK